MKNARAIPFFSRTVHLFIPVLMLPALFQVEGQRYLLPVFSSVTKTANIIYGSNINRKGALEELRMDIYEPEGDAISARPLIIFVHGGGFVGGDKGTAQFVTLCTEFARRGYVTASINYRLDTSTSTYAMMNAMHDARAAVRFFRRYRATYRIDTTRIAIGGGSAGAYTSLFVSYIDLQSELYPASGATDVEGGSGNPGFSSRVHACLDYWGALQNPDAIESVTDPPLIIIHGTEDHTVPFSNATRLDARATETGLYHEFYPFQGAGHGPWNEMDSIVNTTARFLYKVLLTATTGVDEFRNAPDDFLLRQNYPNPFSSTTIIVFRIGSEVPHDIPGTIGTALRRGANHVVSLKVFDLHGREAVTLVNAICDAGEHAAILDGRDLPPGIYLVRLSDGERVRMRSALLLH